MAELKPIHTPDPPFADGDPVEQFWAREITPIPLRPRPLPPPTEEVPV